MELFEIDGVRNGTSTHIIMNASDIFDGQIQNFTTIESKNQTEVDEPPFYLVMTATVLYCLIFLVGVVGNSLVIFVISCCRRMKTAVNMYLVNLCVADLLVIMICMPTALAELFTRDVWYFGAFMCKYCFFINSLIV